MTSLTRKWLPLSEKKKKAIAKVELRTKPSKIVKKYDVPRNTISTWLLLGNTGKLSVFQSGEVSKKWKNVRLGQNENLEKALFDWYKTANEKLNN